MVGRRSGFLLGPGTVLGPITGRKVLEVPIPAGMQLQHAMWHPCEVHNKASAIFPFSKTTTTLPETNELPMKIPMFPCKYHQNGGFSMAMLVLGRVTISWFLQSSSNNMSFTFTWWFLKTCIEMVFFQKKWKSFRCLDDFVVYLCLAFGVVSDVWWLLGIFVLGFWSCFLTCYCFCGVNIISSQMFFVNLDSVGMAIMLSL